MVRPLKLFIFVILFITGVLAGYKHNGDSKPTSTSLTQDVVIQLGV